MTATIERTGDGRIVFSGEGAAQALVCSLLDDFTLDTPAEIIEVMGGAEDEDGEETPSAQITRVGDLYRVWCPAEEPEEEPLPEGVFDRARVKRERARAKRKRGKELVGAGEAVATLLRVGEGMQVRLEEKKVRLAHKLLERAQVGKESR